MSIFLRRFFGRDGEDEADLIPPERPAAPRPRQPVIETGPVVDAEFREVAQLARDCAPEERFAEVPRSPRAAPRVRPAAIATGGLARASAFWAVVAVLSAGSFWFAGGHALAERLAGRPTFAISDVDTMIVTTAGREVLLVAGRVENRSGSAKTAPVVLVKAGAERHAVDIGRKNLEAGETVTFSGRLAAPADKDATIRVSLVDMQTVQSVDEMR
jgi:hypothetical protein